MKNTINFNVDVSPRLWLDYNGWRSKSSIVPNFDHTKFMLDSELNICYINTMKYGTKNVIHTTNIDKSKQNISASSKEVLTDIPRKSVFEVNYSGKQWLMQSFNDNLISLILIKTQKLRGRIWKKM